MNKFIQAVTSLDLAKTKQLLREGEQWCKWSQPDGKNALHFVCAVPVVSVVNVPASELGPSDPQKTGASLAIAKLLIKNGIDINSIHKIPDKNCTFAATPIWYAYTRGRNEKLYTWLLQNGGRPDNCMFAIAWYDDPKAAELFHKQGLEITDNDGRDTPFLAAMGWKKFNIAKWLLENGADVNVTDERGNTPLLYSVKKKYPLPVIEMLVKHGADPDKVNARGESARQIASSYRDKAILHLLP